MHCAACGHTLPPLGGTEAGRSWEFGFSWLALQVRHSFRAVWSYIGTSNKDPFDTAAQAASLSAARLSMVLRQLAFRFEREREREKERKKERNNSDVSA